MNEVRVYIKQSIVSVAYSAAETFVRLTKERAAQGLPFRVALSGGSTPKLLYSLLVSDTFRGDVPWGKIDFFFGDERWVPHTDPASNFKLANDNLLKPLGITQRHIFSIPAPMTTRNPNITPKEAAAKYEAEIRRVFRLQGDEAPRFDLIFLGMGDEGHTASLFPHTAVLHENEKLVAATYVEKLNANRITLTPLTLNAARHTIFMVSGAPKAEALKQALEGEYDPDEYPAQLLRNSLGDVTWLVDKEAAVLLEGEYPVM